MKKYILLFAAILCMTAISLPGYSDERWNPELLFSVPSDIPISMDDEFKVYPVSSTSYLIFSGTHIFVCRNFNSEVNASIQIIDNSLLFNRDNNFEPVYYPSHQVVLYASGSDDNIAINSINISSLEKTRVPVFPDGMPWTAIETRDGFAFLLGNSELWHYNINTSDSEMIDSSVNRFEVNSNGNLIFFSYEDLPDLIRYDIFLGEVETVVSEFIEDFGVYQTGHWILFAVEQRSDRCQIFLADSFYEMEISHISDDVVYSTALGNENDVAFQYSQSINSFLFVKIEANGSKALYSARIGQEPVLIAQDVDDFRLLSNTGKILIAKSGGNGTADLYISSVENIGSMTLMDSDVVVDSIRYSSQNYNISYISQSGNIKLALYDITSKSMVYSEELSSSDTQSININYPLSDVFIFNIVQPGVNKSVIISDGYNMDGVEVPGRAFYIMPEINLCVLYDPADNDNLKVYSLTGVPEELRIELAQHEQPETPQGPRDFGTMGVGLFGGLNMITMINDYASLGIGPDVGAFFYYQPFKYLQINLGFSFGTKKINFPLSKNPDVLTADGYISSDYIGIPVLIKGGYPLGDFSFFGSVGIEPGFYIARIGKTTQVFSTEEFVASSNFDILLGATVIYDLTSAFSSLFNTEYGADIYIDILVRLATSDYITGETFFSEPASYIGFTLNLGLTVYKFDLIVE